MSNSSPKDGIRIAAGYVAAGRVPAQEFRQILYVILVVMCLHTIWNAVHAL